MKISMNKTRYILSALFVGALSLNGMEAPSALSKDAAAMLEEDYDKGEAALRELSFDPALKFLLSPTSDEDYDEGRSNTSKRAEFIEAHCKQDIIQLREMLAKCSTTAELDALKLIFCLYPVRWPLSIFDTSCKDSLMDALFVAYNAEFKGIGETHSEYAKKLGGFRKSTEWLFKPWWVPSSLKCQYNILTGQVQLNKKGYGKAEVNKPKSPTPVIASQKGLLTHFWDLAWKRPVVTCSIVGATLLGGYYAVKNNLFSNVLGRARSSLGSGLGSTLQRR